MLNLGIDAGAFSVQIAVLSEDGKIVYKAERAHNKKVKETASAMFEEAFSQMDGHFGACSGKADNRPGTDSAACPESADCTDSAACAEGTGDCAANTACPETIRVCACGSMSHLLNLPQSAIISDQAAISAAWSAFAPQAASVIVLGAQKTRYLSRPDGVHAEVQKNSNCSAGTGAFFEEQASRLQMRLEDISAAVKTAQSVPDIAGRCSVFSKTDMIHRMQEGVSTPDILLGLCYALVRNFRSSILRNQKPQLPVYLAGGVMKNAGVIRALKELLDLKDGDYILDENSACLGALGAAMKAGQNGEIMAVGVYASKGNLAEPGGVHASKVNLAEPGEVHVSKVNLAEPGEVHASKVNPAEPAEETAGKSLLERITEKTIVQDESGLLPLAGFCTDSDSPEFKTVPYRKNEETFLGIDVGSTSINLVLINEAREVIYYSYVKTLGKPLDIVRTEIDKMQNALPDLTGCKVAVTGSGREYIGKKIGADLVINEITAQTEGALLSHPQTDTVFEIGGQDSKYMSCRNGKMTDFEMNKVCAAGTGAFLEEQIHKLGISMAEFTEYALRAKHPCQLGNRCTVFIEGSVNQALAFGYSMEDVCAGLAYAIVSNYLFRVVNRKPIGNQIAIQGGIAYNRAVVCAFRAITGKEIHVSPYFAVTGAYGCASLLINRSQLAFDAEKNRRLNRLLLERSEESYLKDYQKPSFDGRKKVVGVPRVVFLHKMFPLFNALFTNLGFEVLISPLSNADIVKKAQQYCTAETCFPIKLIYGHIAWLLEQKADIIVLPRLYTIRHEGSVARKDYACMYMQTSPLLMEQAFHFKERGVQLIMPELSLQFGKKYMLESILSIAPQIGVPKVRMLPAAASAFAKLVAHAERLEAIGKESLQGNEPVFVLVSRVYNIIDPVLNMGIEEHLNAIGCRVIHLEHLEASVMHVEHDYPDLYWPFGQHILTGLKLVKAHKNMYPIYITNHGCGPDTAIQHFFRNEMEDREYLQLEVDEHTSKVGVITRLEAFLYSLQPQQAVGEDQITYGKGGCSGCTACADQGKQVDLTHFDRVLIPDYGIYSDIIEKYVNKEVSGSCSSQNAAGTGALPEDSPVAGPVIERVQPLIVHKTFDYAMNKEYYSMLIMLEELRNTVRKGVSYVMVAPIDEGSEVFGQYALLCTQELRRLGYDVTLRPFYVEDLIKRDDYAEIFRDMVAAEMRQKTANAGSLNEQNVNGHNINGNDFNAGAKRLFVCGEPMCVCKPYILSRNLQAVSDSDIALMPLSELLLFHMLEIDRKHEFVMKLKKWQAIQENAMSTPDGSRLYTPIKMLQSAASGKLDFCIGDGGKYRFAKLLCLSENDADAAVLMNSSEENTAIILKQLTAGYRSEISVPFIRLDLDYEHTAGKEDFELI